MTRVLIMIHFLLLTEVLSARTTKTTIAGAVVNSWIQAGLRVTSRTFDLAVQGQGFFILKDSAGGYVFTRYGAASLNPQNLLLQTDSGLPVMAVCGNSLQTINLEDFSIHADGSAAKSMRVNEDGSIVAHYENGYSKQHECAIALAIFQNASKLKRVSQHIFKETDLSGNLFAGHAQQDARGRIYAATLEEPR